MSKRMAALVMGAVLVFAQEAGAQDVRQALEAFLRGVVATESIRLQTATFPIPSSSGGFTWTFDPALGVSTRRSRSFGPVFAERSFTTGMRKLNVAVNFQRTTFESFAGKPLSDFVLVEPSALAVTTFQSSIELESQRTIVNATYGVTNRWDVGLIVPFARTHVVGERRIVSTGGSISSLAPLLTLDRSAAGLGDIVFRSKFALTEAPALALAVGIDFKADTTDVEKLLGTDSTSAKLMIIGTSTRGDFATHFNVGYTFGGRVSGERTIGTRSVRFSDDYSRSEIGYVLGADIAASSAITVAGDLVGRTMLDTLVPELVGPSFVATGKGTMNLLLGAIGVKVNVGGSWLITGSVLFPLNDNGLKPNVTPVIGLERAF